MATLPKPPTKEEQVAALIEEAYEEMGLNREAAAALEKFVRKIIAAVELEKQ